MATSSHSKFLYAVSLALQLGFLIALPLTGFLLIGIFLDRKLNSSPLFLILSLIFAFVFLFFDCLLYTSPSPRDLSTFRMPSSA